MSDGPEAVLEDLPHPGLETYSLHLLESLPKQKSSVFRNKVWTTMQSGQSCVIAEVLPLAPSSATRRITQTTVIEIEDEASMP